MMPLRILVALKRSLGFDRDAFVGISQAAQGYEGVFLDLTKEGATLTECIKESKARGVIVSTSEKRDIDELVATGLPCVNIANDLSDHARVPVVGNDDEALGRIAAEHYLDRSFRNFAYLANPINSYFDARRDAFCRAVTAAGFTCAIAPPLNFPEWETPVHEERIANWLASLPKPLAVLCPYDNDARRAVHACILAGLRIPEEVSIMGVDNDLTLCLTILPQLSSVATAATQIGRTALRLLMSLIEGDAPPGRPILVPPIEVVARGSTGEVAIDDADVAAAVHFLRTNLRQRLTVAKVADIVAVSRRTLERKFFHLLGRSPLEELRRSRVERAKSLLINTDLEYVEIARMSGLIHVQRLSKLVKQDTGLTPRQFRGQFGRAT